jgi:hypothetical protein
MTRPKRQDQGKRTQDNDASLDRYRLGIHQGILRFAPTPLAPSRTAG